MIGVITSWDILKNPIVTIQCFGWQVFFKALVAGQHQTFLSLLATPHPTEETASRLWLLIDRCIRLELRAKQIYGAFAMEFGDQPAASQFFSTLVEQEQSHADLLALCRIAAGRGDWSADPLIPWEDCLVGLEQRIQEAEEAQRVIGDLDEALELVVQIESSEVNRVFHDVLAACDSDFVRRLPAFRQAIDKHMTFIAESIPQLSPNVELASVELRELVSQNS